MSEPIENTADAIIALYNASPRMPTRDQVIELLKRCEQMPGMRVQAAQGLTYYVVGDDALPVSTAGAFS